MTEKEELTVRNDEKIVGITEGLKDLKDTIKSDIHEERRFTSKMVWGLIYFLCFLLGLAAVSQGDFTHFLDLLVRLLTGK